MGNALRTSKGFSKGFWAAACLAVLLALVAALFSYASYAAEQSSGDRLFAQGQQAFQRGAFDQAASHWQEAAQAYERDSRSLDRSRALTHLAHAYQALGQLMKALQTLDLALALAQPSNDPAWIASILDSLGRGYMAAGKLEAAGQYFDQALGMARPLARPDLTATILNDKAILLAA